MAFKNLREELAEEFAELSGYSEAFDLYSPAATRIHEERKLYDIERYRRIKHTPGYKARRRAKAAKRWRENPAYRERAYANRKKRLEDPAKLAAHREQQRKYRDARKKWREEHVEEVKAYYRDYHARVRKPKLEAARAARPPKPPPQTLEERRRKDREKMARLREDPSYVERERERKRKWREEAKKDPERWAKVQAAEHRSQAATRERRRKKKELDAGSSDALLSTQETAT